MCLSFSDGIYVLQKCSIHLSYRDGTSVYPAVMECLSVLQICSVHLSCRTSPCSPWPLTWGLVLNIGLQHVVSKHTQGLCCVPWPPVFSLIQLGGHHHFHLLLPVTHKFSPFSPSFPAWHDELF